jgi:diguanylate cyclase (GGDEF)-like protein
MNTVAPKPLRLAHARRALTEMFAQDSSNAVRARREDRDLERELLETRAQLRLTETALERARARERRATQQALHDSLTTLPNRALFRTRLDEALHFPPMAQDSVAVMYVDLDGFKDVNDTHGHAVGDELLHIIGTRLARAVRGGDTVARLGGDEFACLLVGVAEPAQVQQRARELMKAVSAKLRIGNRLITGRASIGIAMSPADGIQAEDLLDRADQAMYRAKQNGSGIEFYSSSSH